MKYVNPVLWIIAYVYALWTFRDFVSIDYYLYGYEYLAFYLLGMPAVLPIACLMAYDTNTKNGTLHSDKSLSNSLFETFAACILWPVIINIAIVLLLFWAGVVLYKAYTRLIGP